ncbi:Drug resistance protein [Wickerhamomyces ciferrii]|uniref:Drug resistance protein n=1 Tax=Wickerhamomyces ciferrii (strain ATCC 14091 / BCRC 22168 / CBS 111 / JCM 3599 / NBRC 0793 / NRRL Y-1031 F-60-10) TaxID=1206466 RepID=K0KT79_WICCF|nr:Drug resistance protein [Wickerhamomyces ciferrii]CCH46361.1 Drug resistance protein [Wickerhamomyces ciferrii]
MMAQLISQASPFQTLPMMNLLEKSFNNVSDNDKVWFMASNPLTSGAFILISGKFGDLYGLKLVFNIGICWCSLWSLLVGLSSYTHSVIFFCICRAMQGIGLALILSNAIGIAGNLYPNGQRKAIVFCLIAAFAPIGAALGTLFGGLTAQFGVWQWSFYSTAILLFLMAVISHFVIPYVEPLHKSPNMDWWGAITGVCGLILLSFAWNQAPEAGWSSPYIIVILILGLISLAVFFYIEKWIASSPLLPNEIMNFNLLMVLSITALGWGSFSVWTYYYWSFILNLKHFNPLISGTTYVTFLVFGVIACLVVSLLIKRVQPSYLLLAAMICFVVGLTMLSVTPVNQSYFKMLFPQIILLSFGVDMSFPAALIILSDSLPKKHQGMSSSLVTTMVNYEMSIALGIASSAEVEIKTKTGELLKAYRAALYVGIGLAAISVIFSVVFVVSSKIWPIDTTEDEHFDDFKSKVNIDAKNYNDGAV